MTVTESYLGEPEDGMRALYGVYRERELVHGPELFTEGVVRLDDEAVLLLSRPVLRYHFLLGFLQLLPLRKLQYRVELPVNVRDGFSGYTRVSEVNTVRYVKTIVPIFPD